MQIDHLWPFSECQRSQVEPVFFPLSPSSSLIHTCVLAKFTKCKIDNVLMSLSLNLFSVDVDQLTDLVILPGYCHNCWKKRCVIWLHKLYIITDQWKHISKFYVFDIYPSAPCPHSSLAIDTVSIYFWVMKKKLVKVNYSEPISIGHQKYQCEKHTSSTSGLTGCQKEEGRLLLKSRNIAFR